MEKPEFNDEQIARRFKEIVEAEQALDNQAFLLREKQQGDQPDLFRLSQIIGEHDPYPDNLGDRWTRQSRAPKPDIADDGFDDLWYQGRI